MWKIYIDTWCLLIEKGIWLTGNVCILSKLVILLNHKKAMNIPNRLSILHYISFIFTRNSHKYSIFLGCKLILITWTWHYIVPWLLFLTLTQIQDTKILFTLTFFIVYDMYLYVIFFAMYVDYFLCLMKLNNA